MTNEHQPPVPPPPPGYDADEAAFASFTRGLRPLGDGLRGDSLDAHTGLHGDTFSRVGNEVGLSDAVRNATRFQVQRMSSLAGTSDAMTDAVANTWTNYVDREDHHDRAMRRAGGEQP